MRSVILDAAAECAADLVRRGYPPSEAVRLAAGAAQEIGRPPANLGETAPPAAEPPVLKEARELVSPWLWIFSLVSFGMAVTNYQRISKMFRKWKSSSRKG